MEEAVRRILEQPARTKSPTGVEIWVQVMYNHADQGTHLLYLPAALLHHHSVNGNIIPTYTAWRYTHSWNINVIVPVAFPARCCGITSILVVNLIALMLDSILTAKSNLHFSLFCSNDCSLLWPFLPILNSPSSSIATVLLMHKYRTMTFLVSFRHCFRPSDAKNHLSLIDCSGTMPTKNVWRTGKSNSF